MKKIYLLLFLTGLFFAGCGTDYEILQSQTNIVLTADSSVKVIGETITFTVKDADGNDLTQQSTFEVDGTAIDDNTFTSDVTGNFQVTASYAGIDSDPMIVNFHDGTVVNFRKKVLIEDYTGTWCGFCPRVAWGIELVKEQSNDVVAVAIHRPSSEPTSGVYDPYNFPAAQELENTLGAEGYPKGFLNRKTQWSFPEPNYVNEPIAMTQGENPKLGLAMSAAVEGGNITLDVNVMFGKDFTNNLKLVVYVLENGLIYEQHNYTTYYDGVDVIEDFEHNHVLRACLTNILGDAVDGAEATTGNVYTRTFSVPVPANMANAANIEFVAFIVDENGNSLNVRSAHPGEAQGFELL